MSKLFFHFREETATFPEIVKLIIIILTSEQSLLHKRRFCNRLVTITGKNKITKIGSKYVTEIGRDSKLRLATLPQSV